MEEKRRRKRRRDAQLFFSPRVLYPPQRASFMENEMAPIYTYRGELAVLLLVPYS